MEFVGWVGIAGLMLIVAADKTPYLRTLTESGKDKEDFSETTSIVDAFKYSESGRVLNLPMYGATESISGVDRLGFVGVGADDVPYWDRHEGVSVSSMRQRAHRNESDYVTTHKIDLTPQQNQACYEKWVPHVNEVHVNKIKNNW